MSLGAAQAVEVVALRRCGVRDICDLYFSETPPLLNAITIHSHFFK
jgi:hypothetical protein